MVAQSTLFFFFAAKLSQRNKKEQLNICVRIRAELAKFIIYYFFFFASLNYSIKFVFPFPFPFPFYFIIRDLHNKKMSFKSKQRAKHGHLFGDGT